MPAAAAVNGTAAAPAPGGGGGGGGGGEMVRSLCVECVLRGGDGWVV